MAIVPTNLTALVVGTDAAGDPILNSTPGALLELVSSDSALLISRMTTAQRLAIPSPEAGMIVYDTSTNYFNIYMGSPAEWQQIAISSGEGNVVGPLVSEVNDIATFGNMTGTALLDSGVGIALRGTNFALGPNVFFTGLTTGSYSTGFGTSVLTALTMGNRNSAFGFEVLSNTTSGINNCGFGTTALLNNVDGSNNCAFGEEALVGNVSGSDNVAVGFRALYSSASSESTASESVAIGSQAMMNDTTGFNVAVGYQAMMLNTGEFNTALGWKSMSSNVEATGNTAIGNSAMLYTTGGNNTAVGNSALAGNIGVSTGSANTAVGNECLNINTEGSYNTGVGSGCLALNTEGENNIGIGSGALGANTEGNNNIAIGVNALSAESDTYDDNIAIGYTALQNNTGGQNIAIGTACLDTNTSGGVQNVGVGYNALGAATGASQTVALGWNAGDTYQIYLGCTLVGRSADTLATNLTNVSCFGAAAQGGDSDTTAIGAGARVFLNSTYGTALGAGSVVAPTCANSTAIGAQSNVSVPNATVIGPINTGTTPTTQYTVGIGTTSPNATLHALGSIQFQIVDFTPVDGPGTTYTCDSQNIPDYIVGVIHTSGTNIISTVNLPALVAADKGRIIVIRDQGYIGSGLVGATTITVSGNGATIYNTANVGGTSSVDITVKFDGYTFYTDGINWFTY